MKLAWEITDSTVKVSMAIAAAYLYVVVSQSPHFIARCGGFVGIFWLANLYHRRPLLRYKLKTEADNGR